MLVHLVVLEAVNKDVKGHAMETAKIAVDKGVIRDVETLVMVHVQVVVPKMLMLKFYATYFKSIYMHL